MDSLEMTLSTGRKIWIGGKPGPVISSLIIPANHKVIGFYGGTGGHLHNFGCYIMPIIKES
jgi:hypothetical protein